MDDPRQVRFTIAATGYRLPGHITSFEPKPRLPQCYSVIPITIENQPIPTVFIYTACLLKRIFGQKNHFLDDSTPASTNPEFV
ncbi:MAG: hypothetical protein ABSG18_25105 [Steroidobacteraceae bacterium]|jgi:hypothetical protein